MQLLRTLVLFFLITTSAFPWLGGSGTGGGGGGSLTGAGTAGRLSVWTGATALGNSLITSPGTGVHGFLDSGSTLRLSLLSSGADAIVRPASGSLILQDMGSVDRLLIQSGLAPLFPTGAMFSPQAAPAADATRDIIFKDTADGEIKVRKSTFNGGALVSLESGGTSATFVQNAYIPTGGQTVFTLSTTFVGATGLSVATVNGMGMELGTNYTISGTTFTWLDTPYTLDGADRLVVKYQTN